VSFRCFLWGGTRTRKRSGYGAGTARTRGNGKPSLKGAAGSRLTLENGLGTGGGSKERQQNGGWNDAPGVNRTLYNMKEEERDDAERRNEEGKRRPEDGPHTGLREHTRGLRAQHEEHARGKPRPIARRALRVRSPITPRPIDGTQTALPRPIAFLAPCEDKGRPRYAASDRSHARFKYTSDSCF